MPMAVRALFAVWLGLFIGACAQAPMKPSPNHVQADGAAPAGTIPAPVQISTALPRPRPALKPETYSVVVNNVSAQDLLFALARDARLNIDIHPGIAGAVTLNAVEQTLPQLLLRISRQVSMRYELHDANLLVLPDDPFLRTYKVDFVTASRDVKMQSQASTQFGGGGTAGGAGAASTGSGTGSTASIDVASNSQLWESLVQNLRSILGEAPGPAAAAKPAAGAAAPAGAQGASDVIGNRESGVLYVRASSRQHERVQEFLDSVLANVRRQVLIEATVAEVQLSNEIGRASCRERV